MEYKVTQADFEHCIAEWINSDHPDYATYVRGIKLFKEYLEGRNSPTEATQERKDILK